MEKLSHPIPQNGVSVRAFAALSGCFRPSQLAQASIDRRIAGVRVDVAHGASDSATCCEERRRVRGDLAGCELLILEPEVHQQHLHVALGPVHFPLEAEGTELKTYCHACHAAHPLGGWAWQSPGVDHVLQQTGSGCFCCYGPDPGPEDPDGAAVGSPEQTERRLGARGRLGTSLYSHGF